MKIFFKELFEYTHHFNQKLADAIIENADQTSERSIELFNHIINAQQIWNSRVARDPNVFGAWEIHELKSLKKLDSNNFENSLKLLKKKDFDAKIEYANSRGQVYNNSVKDIFFHIINHSTHHRGQIIVDMKQNGTVPFSSDYIFYKR